MSLGRDASKVVTVALLISMFFNTASIISLQANILQDYPYAEHQLRRCLAKQLLQLSKTSRIQCLAYVQTYRATYAPRPQRGFQISKVAAAPVPPTSSLADIVLPPDQAPVALELPSRSDNLPAASASTLSTAIAILTSSIDAWDLQTSIPDRWRLYQREVVGTDVKAFRIEVDLPGCDPREVYELMRSQEGVRVINPDYEKFKGTTMEEYQGRVELSSGTEVVGFAEASSTTGDSDHLGANGTFRNGSQPNVEALLPNLDNSIQLTWQGGQLAGDEQGLNNSGLSQPASAGATLNKQTSALDDNSLALVEDSTQDDKADVAAAQQQVEETSPTEQSDTANGGSGFMHGNGVASFFMRLVRGVLLKPVMLLLTALRTLFGKQPPSSENLSTSNELINASQSSASAQFQTTQTPTPIASEQAPIIEPVRAHQDDVTCSRPAVRSEAIVHREGPQHETEQPPCSQQATDAPPGPSLALVDDVTTKEILRSKYHLDARVRYTKLLFPTLSPRFQLLTEVQCPELLTYANQSTRATSYEHVVPKDWVEILSVISYSVVQGGGGGKRASSQQSASANGEQAALSGSTFVLLLFMDLGGIIPAVVQNRLISRQFLVGLATRVRAAAKKLQSAQ